MVKTPKQLNLPVIAICDSLGKNCRAVYQHGIGSVFSVIETPSELSYLLAHGERFLARTVESTVRLIKLND